MGVGTVLRWKLISIEFSAEESLREREAALCEREHSYNILLSMVTDFFWDQLLLLRKGSKVLSVRHIY